MKLNVIKETKTWAEDIRAKALSGLSLEPAVVQRFVDEVEKMRNDLDYEKAPPLEKLMIEQVLTSHTQNMVALHNLETIPINADVPYQKQYLERRVIASQTRLIRAVCVLAGLQRIGRHALAGSENSAVQLPGMRPPQTFTKQELKGSPIDYLDEDVICDEDRQRNEAIRRYWAEREARWQAYEETAEDLKPRRLVRVLYRANNPEPLETKSSDHFNL